VSDGTPRGFLAAIAAKRDARHLAVIAEIKRHSPSVGELDHNLDPSLVAEAYELGGATCLSVLTDSERFYGSCEDLGAAHNASSLPILRKDFIRSVEDVERSATIGADAVLLIASDLDQGTLGELQNAAQSMGMDVLVEVHTPHDLEKALEVDPEAVGVNQRDLGTMEIDPRIHGRMIDEIPNEILVVAESGIASTTDAQFLFEIGYDAVLVGTYLIKSLNQVQALRTLTSIR